MMDMRQELGLVEAWGRLASVDGTTKAAGVQGSGFSSVLYQSSTFVLGLTQTFLVVIAVYIS